MTPDVSSLAIPKSETFYEKQQRYVGRFRAMGSPCELLIRDCSQLEAHRVFEAINEEVWRIEKKFSRYRSDNIVAKINRSNGTPVRVDEETARLIDTANALWGVSEGLFDITSGSLRRAWNFDRGNRLPDPSDIKALLDFVGWDQVTWADNEIILPPKFEIDFGGIGKEYATDRCLALALQLDVSDVLINLGGDIAVHSQWPEAEPWEVGVECTHLPETHDAMITIGRGGIATSGDTNKYLIKDGIRYSHVLDPRTGWSVREAPQSVTVAASSCSEAGMYSTLAMLHGENAEQFLRKSKAQYWLQR